MVPFATKFFWKNWKILRPFPSLTCLMYASLTAWKVSIIILNIYRLNLRVNLCFGPKKLRIRTIFTQCLFYNLIISFTNGIIQIHVYKKHLEAGLKTFFGLPSSVRPWLKLRDANFFPSLSILKHFKWSSRQVDPKNWQKHEIQIKTHGATRKNNMKFLTDWP